MEIQREKKILVQWFCTRLCQVPSAWHLLIGDPFQPETQVPSPQESGVVSGQLARAHKLGGQLSGLMQVPEIAPQLPLASQGLVTSPAVPPVQLPWAVVRELVAIH